jgi:hypothetical protein
VRISVRIRYEGHTAKLIMNAGKFSMISIISKGSGRNKVSEVSEVCNAAAKYCVHTNSTMSRDMAPK